MGNTISTESPSAPAATHYHTVDCPRETQTVCSDFADLLSASPKIESTPHHWTNQCYFASIEETLDQPAIDNQVMLSLRAAATQQFNANQNNNNNQSESATTKL